MLWSFCIAVSCIVYVGAMFFWPEIKVHSQYRMGIPIAILVFLVSSYFFYGGLCGKARSLMFRMKQNRD